MLTEDNLLIQTSMSIRSIFRNPKSLKVVACHQTRIVNNSPCFEPLKIFLNSFNDRYITTSCNYHF